MNRGPENVFGKAPGQFDEAMARRLAASLPDQAIAACAAMDDDTFLAFVESFNALFDRGARVARIAVSRIGGREASEALDTTPNAVSVTLSKHRGRGRKQGDAA